MNAIPLINNAPRPNINVGSIGSPAFNPVAAGAKLGGSIGGNVMRQNPASMPVNNETQLRQEVNTSIVALKREAFSLENLIAQAAQTLQDINKRLSELEGKQGDYVKKADATVESVGGDGKYISAISETDGKINATATDLGNMVPVNSVTSGNMHSVTSNAVASYKVNSVTSGNTKPVTSGAVASAIVSLYEAQVRSSDLNSERHFLCSIDPATANRPTNYGVCFSFGFNTSSTDPNGSRWYYQLALSTSNEIFSRTATNPSSSTTTPNNWEPWRRIAFA
jgi:hypothetical protein